MFGFTTCQSCKGKGGTFSDQGQFLGHCSPCWGFGFVWKQAKADQRPVESDGGRIKVYEDLMVTGQIYEVATSQGPVQFIRGPDGVVKMYNVWEVPENAG